MCQVCARIRTKHFNKPNEGALRVWWIPQVPGKPFYWPVGSIKEAKLLLDVLAMYDLFQFNHHIKPDYANAGGLEIYEDIGEDALSWDEWCNEDGSTIDEVDENGKTLEDDE